MISILASSGSGLEVKIPWPILILAIIAVILFAVAGVLSRQWMMRNVFGMALASGVVVRVPIFRFWFQSQWNIELQPDSPSSWLLALLAVLHLVVLLTWKAADESQTEKIATFLAEKGRVVGTWVVGIIVLLIVSSFLPSMTLSVGPKPEAGYTIWEILLAGLALIAAGLAVTYARSQKRERSA